MQIGYKNLVGCVMLTILSGLSPAQESITVHPTDTGQVLENPGMGWVLHYYDNVPFNYGGRLEPSDTVDDYPGLTVVYLRIAWSHLEPQEGRFVWSVLDTPAQRWIDKGKRVALRISCCESFMRYATPQWVQQAGANGHFFVAGKGVDPNGPFWEPDYDDPVFLQKLDNFLAALAARYDANPHVAFIDIGSFGVWGEGHTFHSSRLPYSGDTIRKHIDLHLKHFKRTLLAANDDFVDHGRGRACMDYAAEKGLTLRDDSILVQAGEKAYFRADLAQAFRPKVPVVCRRASPSGLESEHYSSCVMRTASCGGTRNTHYDPSSTVALLRRADIRNPMGDGLRHTRYEPREFLAENRDLVANPARDPQAEINMRLGYRLQLVEASWPSEVAANSKLWFATKWCNAGVAPCLPGGYVTMTLKDSKGGIVGVFSARGSSARGSLAGLSGVDDKFNVHSLPVGEPGKAEARDQRAEFDLPLRNDTRTRLVKPGAYDVYVSVGDLDGTPGIAVPLPNDDGHRRYKLGRVTVVP